MVKQRFAQRRCIGELRSSQRTAVLPFTSVLSPAGSATKSFICGPPDIIFINTSILQRAPQAAIKQFRRLALLPSPLKLHEETKHPT